jgi:hypothetical protein
MMAENKGVSNFYLLALYFLPKKGYNMRMEV